MCRVSTISFDVAGPSRNSLRIVSLLVIAHLEAIGCSGAMCFIGKDAVVWPAETVTLVAGMLSSVELTLIRNVEPFLGAFPVSVITQAPVCPTVSTLVQVRLLIRGGGAAIAVTDAKTISRSLFIWLSWNGLR